MGWSIVREATGVLCNTCGLEAGVVVHTAQRKNTPVQAKC